MQEWDIETMCNIKKYYWKFHGEISHDIVWSEVKQEHFALISNCAFFLGICELTLSMIHTEQWLDNPTVSLTGKTII